MPQDVDFGAIGAQVMSHLEAGGDGTTPTNTPVSGTPAPAGATPNPAPSAQPAQGQQAAGATPNPAEDLIQVQFPDGRTETIARKDLPNAILMQRDYTQKTQKLAEREREFQPILTAAQQLAVEREQIHALLNDPHELAKFVQTNYGQQFNQLLQPQGPQQVLPGVAPDDIITAQQAQAIAEQRTVAYVQQLQQRLQQLESQFEQKTQQVVEKGIQQLTDSQQVAAHQKTLDAHVDSLFEKHPLLKAVPEMGDALRFRVYQQNPQTEEQAMRMLAVEAEKQETAIRKQFEELNKQALAGKAKLVTNGIEAPGGTGIQPEPQSFKKKDGSIDWNKLRGAATEFASNSRR